MYHFSFQRTDNCKFNIILETMYLVLTIEYRWISSVVLELHIGEKP